MNVNHVTLTNWRQENAKVLPTVWMTLHNVTSTLIP